MHPLLNQQMAQLYREEIQRAAAAAQIAHQACINRQRNADNRRSQRALWRLIFGLSIPASSASQASMSHIVPSSGLQERMQAMMRMVGFAAFGAGSLIGSFLGTRFGLLPATLLSSIICLAISLPILKRSLGILKRKHLYYKR